MIDGNKIDVFLNEHEVQNIEIGKSGANVYDIDNSMILKHVKRNEISDNAVWNSYKTESMMYDWFMKKKITYVPQILYNYQTEDEIILLMKKYRMLRQDEIKEEIVNYILKVLVQIHNSPIPQFLLVHKSHPFSLTDKEINRCLNSWINVLNEHEYFKCTNGIEQVANYINEVNKKFFSNHLRLTHGDFHSNNILVNEYGEILVCDWQNTCVGESVGDLSFFISRFSADGYVQKEDEFILTYTKYAQEKGIEINENDIKATMCLANINTTFLYWHEYLQGSSIERVKLIYDKMISDLDWLLNNKSFT